MSNQQLSNYKIAVQITIGAIGHRKLVDKPNLVVRVRVAIEKVRQSVPVLPNTPISFTVSSALAEGADRLIAQEILKVAGSTLHAVLPMSKDAYMQDFETSESRMEFEGLLSKAIYVREFQPKGNRNEAYEQVGHYIVDHCDALIVLWDGKQSAGQGGTGDIVRYAREINCPLFWVHTGDKGQVTVEPGRGPRARPFKDLDVYNSEQVDVSKLERRLKNQRDSLVNQAKHANLPSARLQPTFDYMLRHYFRADLLALRYQHLYHRSGNLVYILAAAAVVLAAFQALFLPDQPRLLIFEVVFMVAALAIVWLGRRKQWHTKWIDYRFLAERFRSTLFMAVSGMDVTSLHPPQHLSLSYSSNDWMIAAFSSVWNLRPQLQNMNSLPIEGIKDFLSRAWIEDQIRYHEGTSKRHYGRQKRMLRASNVLFGLTLLAALLHVLHVGPGLLTSIFILMAIAFPAIGASITAVRMQRDYLRNSMRSADMVGYLKELRDWMTNARDRKTFLQLIDRTEQTMLHENEDWRVVVQFHVPEIPV